MIKKSVITGKHHKDEDIKILLRDVKVDVKRLQQRMEKLESGDQACSTPKRIASPSLISTTQAQIISTTQAQVITTTHDTSLSDSRDHSIDSLNYSLHSVSNRGCYYNQDDIMGEITTEIMITE